MAEMTACEPGREAPPVAAVVLAGGGGRRLGGVHKPALTAGGRTLLDRVLHALRGVRPVVVVGPTISTEVEVHWTREEPPLGGPVAALAAGLDRLAEIVSAAQNADDLIAARPGRGTDDRAAAASAPGEDSAAGDSAGEVLLYAGDQAVLTADTGDRLRAALRARPAADGAVLVDETGRRQWLISCWRVAALRAALPARVHGASLRSVLGALVVAEVTSRPGEAWDVDTPDDLRRLRTGTDPDTGPRPR
ncbi:MULTISPECIES: NTP transferase domain-containing protein [Actinoalloteichus]|uniref:Molybdopterin-guanine dinucleotide biosynthesis protein A n=1 Tax=Actinoalloteichus fjordicus TaxID=1612552 RepID=A0AAC9PS18_9PSEU|nr:MULTISPECIES: NTP transferase domain-containing protein [Actinoalloteichus]APU14361.1 molybdopterin-guanine dinucleotide biosynthesis protein A [Actinoalloteichus fjordicus]APU20330.1 molybdopterin-guanine dinucleotide biosynthesis protein A [Actinoalloteichus sp. GBA129-24]